MATYYCEIPPDAAIRKNLPAYVVFQLPGPRLDSRGRTALYSSDRIWAQHNDGSVEWYKNRFMSPSIPVTDMQEFMMVKLKSMSL